MQWFWLLVTDLHGQIKTKLVSQFKKTPMSGIFMCNLMDEPLYNIRNAEEKRNVTILPDTKRDSPWNLNEMLVLCDAQSVMCPRRRLKNTLSQFKEHGLSALVGIELEWMLLNKETMVRASYDASPILKPNLDDYRRNILKAANTAMIPIESFHGETGNNMLEAVIRKDDAITACDNLQLMRLIVKRTSIECGLDATMAAKPSSDSAGIGCHVHLSLTDQHGNSVPELTTGYALAGILTHLNALSSLLLPTNNSYERIGGNFWTPKYVSWDIDNRAHAIRVVDADSQNAHIEIRLAGGDVNPYIMVDALLKAALDGIKRKLSMPLEKGEQGERLPTTLQDALELLEKNDETKIILDPSWSDHWIDVRKAEITRKRSDILKYY